MNNEPPKILVAACYYEGKVYSLPPPARHHDVIKHMADELKTEKLGYYEQGFVDSLGRFVRRKPAMLIAKRAGQILENRAPVLDDLFSENLW